MITISLVNEKGGCSKTTTCLGIAQNLVSAGYNVLLVDCDWQQNLTALVGGDRAGSGIYDVITGAVNTDRCLQSISTTLYLLPGGKDLKQIETKYIGKPRMYKNVLESVKDYFDYCIVDNTPYMGTSALNSLVASQYALIPMQADLFGISGVNGVISFINEVRNRHNKKLKIAGAVPTLYEPKSTSQPIFLESLRNESKRLHINIFTPIRKSQAIRTAQGTGNLSAYVKGYPGQDFGAVTDELLSIINEKEN